MVVLWAQDGVDGAAGPTGFAQSHRSDDEDISDADSLSQSEGGALDAPLLPPENDEDDAAANSMKITDWATVSKKKQAGPAKKKRKRAHYFRSLESLTELTEVC